MEVSALFAHEPLSAEVRALLDIYVREAIERGRYDFDMGTKIESHLAVAGFELQTSRILADRELSFGGAADPDVLQAWADRFARMPALQDRARRAGVALQEDFLRCLASAAHTTQCRVHFCVARVSGEFPLKDGWFGSRTGSVRDALTASNQGNADLQTVGPMQSLRRTVA